MGWVDLVILGLVVVAALNGLRLGAMVQLTSFLGFWIGLGLGVGIALVLARPLVAGTTRALVTLALVLGLAAIFGTAGRVLGGWAAVTMKRWHLGALDAGLGAAVAALAVLVSIWLVAGFLVQTQVGWLSSALGRSAVLRSVDKLLPPVPSALSQVQALLSSGGFPSVFAEVVPPTASPSLEPTPAAAAALGAPARASVAKVFGAACGGYLEGTGFSVAPGVIATNAHVVAGMARPGVIVGQRSYPATAVLVDPKLDLALLRSAAPIGPPLHFGSGSPPRGTQAAIVGFPENGPEHVSAAAVQAVFDAEGRDIYNSSLVTRQVIALSAQVHPGSSGSPVVGPDGSVLGVVFSRSTVNQDVGYALSADAVRADLAAGLSATKPVSTGACAAGG